MLPPKEDPRWSGLLTESIPHQFKTVVAGLCVSRLRREIKQNAGPLAMKKAIDEIYEFFKKYEAILQEDISAIFK